MDTCPFCQEKTISKFKKIFIRQTTGMACPKCGNRVRLPKIILIPTFILVLINGVIISEIEFPIDIFIVIGTIVIFGFLLAFYAPLVALKEPDRP